MVMEFETAVRNAERDAAFPIWTEILVQGPSGETAKIRDIVAQRNGSYTKQGRMFDVFQGIS